MIVPVRPCSFSALFWNSHPHHLSLLSCTGILHRLPDSAISSSSSSWQWKLMSLIFLLLQNPAWLFKFFNPLGQWNEVQTALYGTKNPLESGKWAASAACPKEINSCHIKTVKCRVSSHHHTSAHTIFSAWSVPPTLTLGSRYNKTSLGYQIVNLWEGGGGSRNRKGQTLTFLM